MRAKTLHRRRWLNRLGTESGFSTPNTPVIVGAVTIDRLGGSWTVTYRDDVGDYHIVSVGQGGDGAGAGGVNYAEKALQVLRAAMILDDLARIPEV